MTAEQQKSLAALTANREPGLIYAYGEAGSDRGGEPQRIFRAGAGYAGRIECEGSGGVGAVADAVLT